MKKNISKIFLLFITGCGMLAGCKKDDRAINENLTGVSNIFAPADNKHIKLQPAANLVETFEWEQAKAADGGLVLYEIAFDQENGDFSSPFYKVVSDNKGVINKLSISHGDLNKIAALGGADFFQTKKFRWTVMASKGTNVIKAEKSLTIELQRPGGFAVLPGTMYLTGSASEGGATLSNASKMHQVSPGVFEIYSKMKAGTYRFVDGITGTPKVYHTYTDNGNLTIGTGGESNFTGPDRIMRISLDFNNVNATAVEIKSIQLWYSQGNTFWFTLPYTSNGIWRYNNYTVNLITVPWGREERYKYKMVYDDGTGDKDLWLNSNHSDPPGQDGSYPSTVEYRTINTVRNNSTAFDFTWKLDRNYLPQGTVADFWVTLSCDVYTQQYQKH